MRAASAPSTPIVPSFSRNNRTESPLPDLPSMPSQSSNSEAGPSSPGTLRRFSAESAVHPSESPISAKSADPTSFKTSPVKAPTIASSSSISGGSLKGSNSANLSEAERLQRELQYWQRMEQGIMVNLPDHLRQNAALADLPPQPVPITHRSPRTPTASTSSHGSKASEAIKAQVSSPKIPKTPVSKQGSSKVVVAGSLPSPPGMSSPTMHESPRFRSERSTTSSPDMSASTVSSERDPESPVQPHKNGDASYTTFSRPQTGSPTASPRTSGKHLVPKARTSRSSKPSQYEHDLSNSLNMDTTPHLGLGLGISPDRLAAITRAAAARKNGSMAQISPDSALPQTIPVPKFVTQSPTPTHPAIFAQSIHPDSPETPSKSPSTAGVAMFPLTSTSDAATPPAVPSILTKTRTAESSAKSSTVRDSPISDSAAFASSNSVATTVPPSPLQSSTLSKAKSFAEKCWNEDETFLRKEKIAEWLGGFGDINQAALISYMDHFDFTGLRLDYAFRRLCEKLYLRAETQQVDRILSTFSAKYMEDNPNNMLGNKGKRSNNPSEIGGMSC